MADPECTSGNDGSGEAHIKEHPSHKRFRFPNLALAGNDPAEGVLHDLQWLHRGRLSENNSSNNEVELRLDRKRSQVEGQIEGPDITIGECIEESAVVFGRREIRQI